MRKRGYPFLLSRRKKVVTDPGKVSVSSAVKAPGGQRLFWKELPFASTRKKKGRPVT